MEFILFTKSLRGMTISQMAETAAGLGFDGLDLAVRKGYPVNPENVASALPAAARECAGRGLSIPLVTTEGGFTDPEAPEAERIYSACAAIGCGLVKLGYWDYEFPGYWERVDDARRNLAGFAKLSEKHGVKSLVHVHSGRRLAANIGFDPKDVGIFADPGHMALDGEDYALGLDMIRRHLAAVAVKDCRYAREEGRWRVEWVPLGQGLVDWPLVARSLRGVGFDGVISFHSEYDELLETILEWTKADVAFLRQTLQAADAA
jgi:sugar phosphate isomerase/epimerase